MNDIEYVKFAKDWDQCFNQYRSLSALSRQILRNCATTKLIEDGFEEVGSSDISCVLYDMWKASDRDWPTTILQQFVNFEVAGS